MRRLFKEVFAGLLICMAAVSDVFAQDHPTQYFWGDITIHEGEKVELYIDSEFDYATSYLNFNTTWEASNGCVKVLTPGTSNRTYCEVEGISNTYGFATRVNCTLAYRTSSDSHKYQVWHGYYNVYVERSDIKVESITLNKTSLTLKPQQEETLIATVKPDNATDKTITWSSSNENVATVSSTGRVTAKTAGSATITCSAKDGSGVKATCMVTVTDPTIKVSSIILNKSSLSLQPNQEETLTATVKPDNATDKTVTWSSNNTNVATVSGGQIKAIAVGNATIICSANDGSGVKATCTVTVTNPSRKGDVNDDGQVNGTDLVALTNMILGKSQKTAAADVNGDGQVNGTDYVTLVNIILGKK